MRDERLQIMLSPEELVAVDDFRFKKRMPSRAAAVRELLRRGLAAEGFGLALAGSKSTDFGVIGDAPESDAEKCREALITNFQSGSESKIGRARVPIRLFGALCDRDARLPSWSPPRWGRHEQYITRRVASYKSGSSSSRKSEWRG